MSRKDYRAVANTLRELKKGSPLPKGWDTIIACLITVFQKDNPRFDKQKFLDYIER